MEPVSDIVSDNMRPLAKQIARSTFLPLDESSSFHRICVRRAGERTSRFWDQLNNSKTIWAIIDLMCQQGAKRIPCGHTWEHNVVGCVLCESDAVNNRTAFAKASNEWTHHWAQHVRSSQAQGWCIISLKNRCVQTALISISRYRIKQSLLFAYFALFSHNTFQYYRRPSLEQKIHRQKYRVPLFAPLNTVESISGSIVGRGRVILFPLKGNWQIF